MRRVIGWSLVGLMGLGVAVWQLRPAWLVDHLYLTDRYLAAASHAAPELEAFQPAAVAGAVEPARVVIDLQRPVEHVDEHFLSVAIDTSQLVGGHFWSASGRVEVGRGSERVAPIDLRRPRLRALARALGPAYLRVGGTEADHVHYAVGAARGSERPPAYELTLDESTWDGLQQFARAAGFELVFTVNAGPSARDADGAWRSENAEQLFAYAAARGDRVAVWELGNEVNGYWFIHGLTEQPSGEQYGRDLWTFRHALSRHFDAVRVAGPASVFFPRLGEPLFDGLGFLPAALEAGGAALDIISWHFYPQQSRRCPVATRRARPDRLLSPTELDEVERWAGELRAWRDRSAPGARLWLGETGHAQCGGEPGLSDRYASGLWWLDQLGRAARSGQAVVVRQTLLGSDYGLLDGGTLEPRPDYFNSLLWRKLMGRTVLDASASGADPFLRVYAHCSPQPGAGVSLLVLNEHPARAARFILHDAAPQVLGHVISAPALDSRHLTINDRVMTARDATRFELEGRALTSDGAPWTLPAASYAFLELRGIDAPACHAAPPTVQLSSRQPPAAR